jgi:hypothetical protein
MIRPARELAQISALKWKRQVLLSPWLSIMGVLMFWSIMRELIGIKQ